MVGALGEFRSLRRSFINAEFSCGHWLSSPPSANEKLAFHRCALLVDFTERLWRSPAGVGRCRVFNSIEHAGPNCWSFGPMSPAEVGFFVTRALSWTLILTAAVIEVPCRHHQRPFLNHRVRLRLRVARIAVQINAQNCSPGDPRMGKSIRCPSLVFVGYCPIPVLVEPPPCRLTSSGQPPG